MTNNSSNKIQLSHHHHHHHHQNTADSTISKNPFLNTTSVAFNNCLTNKSTKTNINNNHLTSTPTAVQHHFDNHNSSINGLNICSTNRRRLEHTPSARTISSDDSWCSERGGSAFDNDLSSEGEDESDRSVTSTSARNSQLRSTLNKAKHHLSFDKWRSGGGGGGGGGSNNSSQSSGSGNVTMPAQTQQETTSPGESPGGRLSRWFSIRRGSSHHYDIGGRETGSRSSSIENVDTALPPQTPRNSGGSIGGGSGNTSGGNKMPQLSEVHFFLNLVI